MSDKVALITGATGLDGAYLAESAQQGYVGTKRRSSSFKRVDHLYQAPHERIHAIHLSY